MTLHGMAWRAMHAKQQHCRRREPTPTHLGGLEKCVCVDLSRAQRR